MPEPVFEEESTVPVITRCSPIRKSVISYAPVELSTLLVDIEEALESSVTPSALLDIGEQLLNATAAVRWSIPCEELQSLGRTVLAGRLVEIRQHSRLDAMLGALSLTQALLLGELALDNLSTADGSESGGARILLHAVLRAQCSRVLCRSSPLQKEKDKEEEEEEEEEDEKDKEEEEEEVDDRTLLRVCWLCIHSSLATGDALFPLSALCSAASELLVRTEGNGATLSLPHVHHPALQRISIAVISDLQISVSGDFEVTTLLNDDDDNDDWFDRARSLVLQARFPEEHAVSDVFIQLIRRVVSLSLELGQSHTSLRAVTDCMRHLITIGAMDLRLIQELSGVVNKGMSDTLGEAFLSALPPLVCALYADQCYSELDGLTRLIALASLARSSSAASALITCVVRILPLIVESTPSDQLTCIASLLKLILELTDANSSFVCVLSTSTARVALEAASRLSSTPSLLMLCVRLVIAVLPTCFTAIEVKSSLCADVLVFCIREGASQAWGQSDDLFLLAIAELMQQALLEMSDGDAPSSAFLDLTLLNPRQVNDFLHVLGLLYYELYGLPVFRIKSLPLPSHVRPIPVNHIISIYHFIEFLPDNSDCVMVDIREACKQLFLYTELYDPPQTIAGVTLLTHVLGVPPHSNLVVDPILSAEWSHMYGNFYEYFESIGVPTNGPSSMYRDLRATLQYIAGSLLLRFRVLLLDLRFSPLRESSWSGVFDCLADVIRVSADCIAEHCLTDELHPNTFNIELNAKVLDTIIVQGDVSGGQECVSDALQRLRVAMDDAPLAYVNVQGDERNTLAWLLLIWTSGLEFCHRLHSFHSTLNFPPTDSSIEASADMLDVLGTTYYFSLALLNRSSPYRAHLTTRALKCFEVLCAFPEEECVDRRCFGTVVIAKARVRLDTSLISVITALKLLESMSANDCEEAEVFVSYQIYSMKLKLAYRLLSCNDTQCDEELSKQLSLWSSEDSTITTNESNNHVHCVWVIALAAIRGLRQCEEMDTLSFKCVYKISSFVLKASQLDSVPDWVLPRLVEMGLADLSAETALEVMSKLFDKRSQRVIAIKVDETSDSRFDHGLLRAAKLDVLTRKYVAHLSHLLSICGDMGRAQELLSTAAASKIKSATLDWVLEVAISCATDILRSGLNCCAGDEEPLRSTFRAYECVRGKAARAAMAPLERTLCDMVDIVSGMTATTIEAAVVFCGKRWPVVKQRQKSIVSATLVACASEEMDLTVCVSQGTVDKALEDKANEASANASSTAVDSITKSI